MGLLRLILALAVIVAHVGPWFGLRFFGGGVMAVECFYMLSGFYMALVISEKYRGQTLRFYFNRFIRLYPIYWLLTGGMLAASVAYWAVAGHPIAALVYWQVDRPPWQLVWGAFSNAAILGCDGAELLCASAKQAGAEFNRLIFIQPAWSLSVEILFYLAAPWILRLRFRWLFVTLFASAMIRAGLWLGGGGHWSPWLYYFFPASWVFFLAGACAFRLYQFGEQKSYFSGAGRTLGWIWVGSMAAVIMIYAQIDLFGFQDPRFYALFALGLPFIFAATRKNRVDAWLAQWSYPLYLGHWAVLSFYPPVRHFVPDSQKIQVVIAASVALATVLLIIDSRIQRSFKRVGPSSCPQAASTHS